LFKKGLSMIQIGEKILLTLWVGGMWTVGYIVTPTLFKMLDKQTAGDVAGQLFTIVSYLGLFAGVVLLFAAIYQSGLVALRHWRSWVLLLMLLLISIGQFVLHPMMVELKAAGLEGVNAGQFGKLHGAASALFLCNSLAGLSLIIWGAFAPPVVD